MIEMDEGYFTIEASGQAHKAQKAGCGNLNEFVYKPNRRYFGERIFDRLVIASITANGY